MKTMTVALEPSLPTQANKGGRPRKELDQQTFEKLCEIQCTLREIAGVLRVSEDTIERWCERTYELGFAECFKKFSAPGKTSLRRYQFDLAKKGNAAMLIWLGKQYLGQCDKPVEEPEEEPDFEEMTRQIGVILEEAARQHRASQGESDKPSC